MIFRNWQIVCSILVAVCIANVLTLRCAVAHELSPAVDDTSEIAAEPELRFNLTLPTMGGVQFWTDELIFRDWRIQRHSRTGHYRLLDDENDRRAWGDFEQCRRKLEALKEKLDLPPVEGKVVIAVHGIMKTRWSLADLCDFLEDRGPYTVLNMSYASSRGPLEDHAAALGKVVANLDPTVTEIHFIGHSLGNLVIRRFLYDMYHEGRGQIADPRIRRIVMLAPPNQGARLAELVRHVPLADWVWGESAVQLAIEWEQAEKQLATPRCQFGILAGGKNDAGGGNPWLPGDDDFIVRVVETRLAGAHDFVLLPFSHGRITRDPLAHEHVLRFLQHGCFVAADKRQPIGVAQ